MADAQATSGYLQIKNITKKFGDFVALDNISLDVHEGEFICFLGPSGCGKTTFLRAIAGLDIQTHGVIEQSGKDISTLPPSERDFGIVFQSYALFPNLKVRRNIAFGLENRGVSRPDIEARVTELLELVGLPDQGNKFPAQLSGGQQQRIALARAIATKPGLLLLDEPLSALDAKVRVHLRHEIKELQASLGITTIMVTHDQEEALTMADRVVVMNHGVIDQVGTPVEIYNEPATAFVADFIGKMNFLPGQVAKSGMVKIGNISLAADTGEFATGDDIIVAIRPESIIILEDKNAHKNIVPVVVREMEFLGSFYRATLTSAKMGDVEFGADFSINMTRRTNIKVGDEVKALMPSERILVYAKGVNLG